MSIIQGTSKSSAAAAYSIDQSIRFNDDDAAYLYRDVASAPTDGKKFTYSVWIKRGAISSASNCGLLSGGSGTSAGRCDLIFTAGAATGDGSNFDALKFDIYSGGFDQTRSLAKLRDPSAWYHIVFVFDAANATANDTMIMYLNGDRLELDSTSGVPNVAALVNANGQRTRIGADASNTPVEFDGYMAEINMIDGQALDPTSFGETNADTGQWVPKQYTGSYGSNGFYITGADSADLGADDSGNGNNFTSSGLTSADQRLDTPTLNKATLNGVNLYTSGSVLSDGNLTVTNSGTTGYWHRSYATQSLSYKTYWEVHADNLGSLNMGVSSLTNPNGGINNPAGNNGAGIQTNEAFVTGSYANESSGSRTFPISTGNYIMFAFDPDRGALWAGTEGTWKDGTASSASSATILAEIEGTGTSYALFTGIDPDDAIPHIAQYSTSVATARFSSEDWEGTAPTGYEQLAPSSLPDPTIADPSAYFQTTLYTGNGVGSGSGGQEINQSGNSTFQPDFVWLRVRNLGTETHCLQDVVRGANKRLQSNSNAAENTETEGLLSFDSDGFTVGSRDPFNKNTATYVAWQWLADNTTGSSNTDGSITSTVSANTTSGFSVGTYTGNGTNNATVGHGLGIAPKIVFVKRTNTTGNWRVYSEAVNKNFYLDLTDAGLSPTQIKSTSSTVFTLGSGNGYNGSGDTHVFYAFGEVDGFSRMSSFVGNGSSDGPMIYTGFRPAHIVIKEVTTADSWEMYDSARDPINVTGRTIRADSANAEFDGRSLYRSVDFLSNGFKIRTSNATINSSGATFIFWAFAESPFKTATAR